MTEHTITVKKGTVRGEARVSFAGMDSLYIPTPDGEAIAQEASERFNLEELDDGEQLATVIAEDSPEHRVVSVEWK